VDAGQEPSAPLPPDPAAQRPLVMMAGRRNFILAAIYVTLWLFPVANAGFTCEAIRGLPRYLNDIWRVSCLFTDRVPSWGTYYFQVRLSGQETWIDVPTSDLSTMKPFGHRSRLDFMLSEATSRTNGDVIRFEMAEFVKKRYELLHPSEPDVAAVRFLQARWAVGEPMLAQPKQHWIVPPLDQVEEWRRRVGYERIFETPGMPTFGPPRE